MFLLYEAVLFADSHDLQRDLTGHALPLLLLNSDSAFVSPQAEQTQLMIPLIVAGFRRLPGLGYDAIDRTDLDLSVPGALGVATPGKGHREADKSSLIFIEPDVAPMNLYVEFNFVKFLLKYRLWCCDFGRFVSSFSWHILCFDQ